MGDGAEVHRHSAPEDGSILPNARVFGISRTIVAVAPGSAGATARFWGRALVAQIGRTQLAPWTPLGWQPTCDPSWIVAGRWLLQGPIGTI
jgi:hypothetical protein